MRFIAGVMLALILSACATEPAELKLISAEEMGNFPVIVKEDRENEWTKAVTFEALPEEPEPEPELEYLGEFRITHYCNCSQCCGQWAGGSTANGARPTAGWTVAADLPFGTMLSINGHTYCVEDRGVYGNAVDIYVDSHSEALARGLYYTDVYIVRG